MTTSTVPSAYPPAIDALLPKARKLAVKLGETPSRNALMKEFKIGAPKAKAILEALTERPAEPAPTAPEVPAPRPLHVVPDLEPDDDRTDAPEPAPSSPTDDVIDTPPLATGDGHPDTNITPAPPPRKPRSWPVWLLALPAFVAIWSGWVGLGELTGFGVVHPLPGIWDSLTLNTAITLPVGVETYAAFALWVWLTARVSGKARSFARWSAIGSLIFGAAGQVAYHLLSASGVSTAPPAITTAVSCLPVAVLGMGAALAHLMHAGRE
jgi:hypothetical protein